MKSAMKRKELGATTAVTDFDISITTTMSSFSAALRPIGWHFQSQRQSLEWALDACCLLGQSTDFPTFALGPKFTALHSDLPKI